MAVRAAELGTAMNTCIKTIAGSSEKKASVKVGELTFGVGGKAIVSVVVDRVESFDAPAEQPKEDPKPVAKGKGRRKAVAGVEPK